MVTGGDLIHASEWIIAIWRLHAQGTQGKSTAREISDTILYVNRLWKPSKEIFSIKSSEKSILGGKVILAVLM
jgi:hypothetical protein